jgi:deoxyribodipyrimidine photolyase-related protein
MACLREVVGQTLALGFAHHIPRLMVAGLFAQLLGVHPRMSNYCIGCRFDPAKSLGDNACPFTTLYWDFLMRHEKRLRANRRMGFQVRNLDRLGRDDKAAIRK